MLVHRNLVTSIVMTHRSLRRELLVRMLLVHLHVIEPPLMLRPVNHVVLIMVAIVKHVGILRRDRIHVGGRAGRAVRGEGSSRVSR